MAMAMAMTMAMVAADIYSVINLILPNSKQLLWHFFTNKQVDVLGDFNLEF